MTIQENFAEKVVKAISDDDTVVGLAVAGSWLTNEIDAYSDLDLILVTRETIGGNAPKMLHYARQFGSFLSGFTGEHVGEPRVLICLYDNPLLHVDIKFVTLDEFPQRIETPAILLDKGDQLRNILEQTEPRFPYPDYQWIEDRFWTWVHYALPKIGRGEYVEAFDFFGFLRMIVFGPLLHIKNGNLPRSVRKVETQLAPGDFEELQKTLPTYSRTSLLKSLQHSVSLYRHLRQTLFSTGVTWQAGTEERVMAYFDSIEKAENKTAAPDGHQGGKHNNG